MSTRVPVEALRKVLEDLFRAAGFAGDDVRAGSDAFLLQEMRGVQTHALRRLPSMLDGAANGEINTRPDRRVIRETNAVAVVDGDFGLGITSCLMAMDQALRLSKRFGIGYSVVVNSNHFLAAAPYCLRAAEAGAVGIAFTHSASGMAYPGTNVSSIGNNPIGFALPTAAGFPLVFDSALTLSGGKLTQWSKQGVQIPQGFLGYDANGDVTLDPAAVLAGGVPLPIGLHKGGGLAILVDVLTAIIGGTTFLRAMPPEDHPEWLRTTNTHSFIAFDIDSFMPLSLFAERMAAYVAELKGRPRAAGYDEVLLPGERASRAVRDSQEHGVPLEADVAERLRELGNRYSVPLPFP
jgi:LDH2 family malate/lactate/ureidoglycolate dehydrogenase